MQTTSNIIDKNWKALIKPNKLEITSNNDKTVAKVVAEPLEKGFSQFLQRNFSFAGSEVAQVSVLERWSMLASRTCTWRSSPSRPSGTTRWRST